MSTGSAKTLLVCAILFALGGCASNEPQTLLSTAELEAMIHIEITPLEPEPAQDAIVALAQP